MQNANAPLKHMFRNHKFCDPNWCDFLKSQQQGKTYHHKYYNRDTKDGNRTYQQLSEITTKYSSEFFL